MGWDYAGTPVMPESHRDAGFMPTSIAAAAAAVLDPNGLHAWDQTKVTERYNNLQDLSGISALVSSLWDSKYATLFEYFEGLEVIHIARCLMLSGVDPSNIMWGTTNYADKMVEVFDMTGTTMTVFSAFTMAAMAAAPFVPSTPSPLFNDHLRHELAETYKHLVPKNVLVGTPDASLVFE